MGKTTTEIVRDHYDEAWLGHADPFDRLGFFNLGYWKGIDDSLELAQINLIETLASFLTTRDGTVLDVACGKGAVAKFLTKYFAPGHITGVNISQKQIDICKIIAPECEFLLMDAADLNFHNSSFDNVLCIESALHFMTRHKFLEEAYRVLKPGGRLAMSDLLLDYQADPSLNTYPAGSFPEENYLPDVNAYRESLTEIGFKYVRAEDSTEWCLKPLMEFSIREMEKEFDRERDYAIFKQLRAPRNYLASCMIYAIK